MQRRFERADKFWEIDYTTTSVRMRWGAIGARGQGRDRDFAGRDEAVRYGEQLVAQQLAAGYVEVTIRPPEAPPSPSSEHRRYEWKVGDQPWFFEAVQTATTVHFRAGRILPTREVIDRSDTRHLTSHAAAAAQLEQWCEEARAQGGVRIDLEARRRAEREAREAREAVEATLPAVDTPIDDNAHAELEQQCLESPDEPGPWEVYADWLEARGDVRARLATLHRSKATTRIDALIREELRGIADDEDDELEDEDRGGADHEVTVACELRFGFVRRATIQISFEAAISLELVTRRFLASPLARFVDELRFGLAGHENDNDWAPALRAVIAAGRAPQIRALEFSAFDSTDSELSWVGFGDFTNLLEQFPRLERLHIRSGAGGALGALALPNLTTFIRESGGLDGTELSAICRATWPNLAHLEVWTGSSNYGAVATISTLKPILAARGLPRVRHLGIVNSELSDELIPALARSAILPQLDSLDLSKGVAGEEAAAALVEHAAAFRHLAALDLSANLLAADDIARIAGVLDNVIATDQRPRYGDERYVAIGE